METKERIDGPTPNGGVQSVAYFRDKNGQACVKSQAVSTEIVELDSQGKVVHRIYLGRSQR